MPYRKSDFSALVAEYLDLDIQICQLQERKADCSEKLARIYQEENPHPTEDTEVEPGISENNLIAIDGEWFEVQFDCEDGRLIDISPSDIKVL